MTYTYRGGQPYVPRLKPVRKDAATELSVFDPSKCGTRAGYAQHRRHGQKACSPCQVANAIYSRDYKRARSAR